MALSIVLVLLCIAVYSLVLFLLTAGLTKSHISPEHSRESGRKVSLIIPFRNEKDNLGPLVQDLLDQSYPKSHFEVILVDDHSEDESKELLEKMISGESGFRCLTLPADSSGKKAALNFGIQASVFDRLIQVDADCRLGRYFIASHMAFLEERPSDLVAGLVTTSRGKGGFLEAYERLDLLALAGTGAGSFGLGRPMMCSGANLAYSRELYVETRRFDPADKIASGDDMFLMIGARKLNRSLAFHTAPEAMVKTTPVKSLGELLSQRIRWGAKSVHYRMADIQALAILVSLTQMGIFLMPLWLILYGGLWPWLAGAWLIKSLADLLLLWKISGVSRQRQALLWFLPVSLAYYPLFFLSLGGILLGRSPWKRDH